jgi:hypothetical protein
MSGTGTITISRHKFTGSVVSVWLVKHIPWHLLRRSSLLIAINLTQMEVGHVFENLIAFKLVHL